MFESVKLSPVFEFNISTVEIGNNAVCQHWKIKYRIPYPLHRRPFFYI